MLFRALTLAVLLTSVPEGLIAEELHAELARFLEKNCFGCHSGDSSEAGLDLASMSTEFGDAAVFAKWVRVHDRVRDGEMPPPGETEPPPKNERDRALDLLSRTLVGADSGRQRTEGRVPLRRLNRNEYENTMRDLFSMPGLRVKELLPEDGRYGGFDKVSSALDVSAVQLRKFLEAADFVLDEAIAHEAKPMVFRERFRRIGGLHCFGEATFPIRDRQVDLDLVHRIFPKDGKAMSLQERGPLLKACESLGILTHARPSFNSEVENFSPFHSGMYRIRTSVWCFDLDQGEMLPAERMQSVAITADGRLLAYLDAPSIEPREHELVVWLNAGETLELNAANLWSNFARVPNWVGSGIAVDFVDVEGPLHDEWPPASHQRLFGNLPIAMRPFERDGEYPGQPAKVQRKPGYRPNHVDGPEFQKNQPIWTAASPRPKEDARRLLTDFLPRAFRRPVTAEDVEVYVKIAHERIDAGDFFEDAMRAAYRVALCSPEFLFHEEPVGVASPSDPMALDQHAVASRLAYFLWNSTPDDELLDLASRNQLHAKKVNEQVDRMLADPRSDRFVEDFLGQWLDLRDINFTSPDRRLYPEFRNDLRDAMLAETRAYFREMLDEDLGAAHVVDSDFVMINQRLAELYGIPGVQGSTIRRVPLPESNPRGGFLTQAAVLKVTANGTVTSPVKRGAWVMDRIVGQPPQPPPPNIPAVDPDVRGTTTIREQLAKHRSEAVCARCHSRMDPPGFALESFDVIGRWRDQYRFGGDPEIKEPDEQRGDDPVMAHFEGVTPHHWKFVRNNVRYGLPVDASGETVDGRTFADIAGLKQILLENEEAIARNLVERLVLYATGAPVSFADRPHVDRILERTRESRYGLRSIIDEIVRSPLFSRK